MMHCAVSANCPKLHKVRIPGHLVKTDQHGAASPDKEDTSGCDMGAYERQSDLAVAMYFDLMGRGHR
jgi:hypothetical protein